jgi:hypothetical protein
MLYVLYDTVDAVDAVDTVGAVDAVDTVGAVDTVDGTGLHRSTGVLL